MRKYSIWAIPLILIVSGLLQFACGTGGSTTPDVLYDAAYAPRNFQWDVDNKQINLRWDPVPFAVGYRVFIARNGKSALKIFSTCHDDIDLVLLDIVMPGMDGKEVFARMKQIKSDFHVLLASGYSLDWQAREMIEDGCHDFIQKPFKLHELSGKVRKVLEASYHRPPA